MYRTHAFPDWGRIDPNPTDDDPQYVQKTARTLKDIFGEWQDTHRPEHDAPIFAKPMAVKAARVLVDRTEDQTLAEVCEVLPWTSADDVDEEIADLEVTPKVLAMAVYGEVVWDYEWAIDQLGDDWDEGTFITINDGVRDLADMAEQEAEDAE
mgnify:CR=1 FL=1